MPTPAQQLLGKTTPDGWTVIEHLQPKPGATGGYFSEGYVVQSATGTKAYLKALDYSSAMSAPDPARMLQWLTEGYNFERDVLNKCKAQRLDKIVAAIGDGVVTVDPRNPVGLVQYIIFELADGDVRSFMGASANVDTAWALRTLHHIATGLQQLHGQDIAHQDLKPSNVLVFKAANSRKISDLGRAAYIGHQPPHESAPVAGDLSYAPPELLYNYQPPDWHQRRFGCDTYLLGSMAVFFFAGAGMTGLLLSHLDPSQRWGAWAGTFADVMPYLRAAYARALEGFKRAAPPSFRDELTVLVQQLCDPDPAQRGHPRNRAMRGNQHSLERYIATFNLLASRAEYGLLRKSP